MNPNNKLSGAVILTYIGLTIGIAYGIRDCEHKKIDFKLHTLNTKIYCIQNPNKKIPKDEKYGPYQNKNCQLNEDILDKIKNTYCR